MATEAETNQGSNPVASALSDMGIADAQQVLDHTREVMGQALDQAAEFIRERPLASLAGAVFLGYLFGKVASR
jgi:hypothetical protein